MTEVDFPFMNLTPRDVATRYSVSLATIYRWVRKGELPALRLGKRVLRFSEFDLASYEETHRSEPKSIFSL